MAETVAVVLSAGVGARVGAETPKQFLDLNGVPALVRSVSSVGWCERVIVVHHPDYADLTRDLLASSGLLSRVTLVPGGATRRQSVAAALEALANAEDDVALVLQNAASPNTPRQLIADCVARLATHDVVVAYVPAVHTIFSHDGRELTEVLPRKTLGYTTDPTVYRLGTLRRIAEAQAASADAGEMTIDTARALGIDVLLVRSPETNLKLTTNNDLLVLRAILEVPPASRA